VASWKIVLIVLAVSLLVLFGYLAWLDRGAK